jgi:cell division protein FtsB
MNRWQQMIGPMMERLMAARRQLATIALVCLAVWLLANAFVSPNGVMAYQKKKTEYKDLQTEIQSLEEQNAKLEKQNQALKNNDPKAIEKEAREQLRYAKPGEVIYVTPEPRRPAAKQGDLQSAENQGQGR